MVGEQQCVTEGEIAMKTETKSVAQANNENLHVVDIESNIYKTSTDTDFENMCKNGYKMQQVGNILNDPDAEVIYTEVN